MADKTLSPSIDTRIHQIEQAVGAIAQGAGEDELHALRKALIGLASVLDRNPGVEMASDDLYASAAVVVADNAAGAHPSVRKLRLLAGAVGRLTARLRTAGERAAEPCDETAVGPCPADVAAVPWQSGFLGVPGPRVLCAPVL